MKQRENNINIYKETEDEILSKTSNNLSLLYSFGYTATKVFSDLYNVYYQGKFKGCIDKNNFVDFLVSKGCKIKNQN